MRTGRYEALDMFSKWFLERSLLRCQISFATHAASVSGRITEKPIRDVRLMADDSLSELVVQLSNDLEFGYGDMRDHPEEGLSYEQGLVVFFGPVPTSGDADTIAFVEIKEDATERFR
jgi:hypothetical protein